MEKIIFFGLVIPIFAFVLYLGVSAIMKGSEAKSALKEEANLKNDELKNSIDNKKNLWVCHFNGACISIFNKKGRKLHKINFPAKQ